jgi:hypothetical protein
MNEILMGFTGLMRRRALHSRCNAQRFIILVNMNKEFFQQNLTIFHLLVILVNHPLLIQNCDIEMSYLVELYKRKEINQMSGFLEFMKNMEIDRICDAYRQLRDIDAPERKNPYFVESHNGISSSGAISTRGEEHLALALFNASRAKKVFNLPDGRSIDFIDYQTPLKAKQSDKGIGKVDLFGIVDRKLPAVIELKIESAGKGQPDTPLGALLEGLAYCAIIEGNISTIAEEAAIKFDIQMAEVPPALVVLAPKEYWQKYLQNKNAGDWLPELTKTSRQFREELNIEILLLAMTDSRYEMGLDGTPAKLTGKCDLAQVEEIADLPG